MSNYKDMVAMVGSLVDRNKPFLIIKYASVFLDRANNTYEIVTIGGSKLRYTPIDRKEALEAISKYELPLLHKVNNRNMIWGDEEFKVKFKEKGLGI